MDGLTRNFLKRRSPGGVAIVTGAAGGIGSTVVRALTEDGARVVAVDHSRLYLERATEPLREAGAAVYPIAADVSSAADATRMVQHAETWSGPVRYLVNAADVLTSGRAGKFGQTGWQHTFAVNTTGVFLMSQAAVARSSPSPLGWPLPPSLPVAWVWGLLRGGCAATWSLTRSTG